MINRELIKRICETSEKRTKIDAELITQKVALEDDCVKNKDEKIIKKAIESLEKFHKEFFEEFLDKGVENEEYD